jgi:cell division protein FtsZ
MAMMGSAVASGPHRAAEAASQAVASPLLDDVNLAGARGVLVNITASTNLKMKEVHEVMNTIKGFTAEDATVIVGTVIDESLGEDLRVTMVATGLGSPVNRLQNKPLQVVKTGTDNSPISMDPNYNDLDTPAVIRRRNRDTVEAMKQSGIETLDIPAFLRKQAD